jgi:hypothetical protein
MRRVAQASGINRSQLAPEKDFFATFGQNDEG